VFNDDEGFFLDDLIGANVSNNTAVSNAGGFVLTPTSNVQTFRRNNSYASTTGCGIENNSGSPLRPDGHYYGDSSGMDPVINLDDHDATCGADLVGDDFRPGPNSTRTRTAQKL
jgi:parallel beta-helix repeat protein